MSGGGGSTGAVSFPDHMEDVHKDWLSYSGTADPISVDLISVMDAALASNPLNSLSYADPTTDISEWEAEYDNWNALIDGLDEHTDIDTIIDNAVAQVDSEGILANIDLSAEITSARSSTEATVADVIESALAGIDDSVLNRAVERFIEARRNQRARLRTQFKAGMANASAERSSAYAIGLALLEIDFERETGEYENQLSLSMYDSGVQSYLQLFTQELSTRVQIGLAEKQTRDQFVAQTVQQMLQYKEFITQMTQQLVSVMVELHRIKFVMDQEYVGASADLNWKHDSWDFEVFQNGIGILGGIGGGQFVPKGPSKAGSALGGALQGAGSGAAAGAAIGAAGGPITAAGGAAIGGLLGIGSALFS